MLRAHIARAGLAIRIVAGAGCGRVGYRAPADDAHGMDAAISIEPA